MVDIIILSIFLNFFACLFLFVFLTSLGKEYRSFAIFNGVVCIWSIFYGISVTSNSKEAAFLFYRFTSVCLVFIPYSFLKFAIDSSAISRSKVYPLKFGRINNIIAIVLAVLMLTPFMIYDIDKLLEFKFVPKITPLFYLYHLYYTVLVIYGLKLINDSSRNNYKNRGLFIGFAIGFAGGTTTLFPFMGLPIYPVGIPLISIYSTIITYVVVKHRVFDGTTAINRVLIRVFSVLTLLILMLVIIFVYSLITSNIKKQNIEIFFLLVFFVLSLELYQVLVFRLSLILERLGWGMPYSKKKILSKIDDKILSVISLEQLVLELKDIIENSVGVRIISFFISRHLSAIKQNNKDDNDDYILCFGNNHAKDCINSLQLEIQADKKFNLSIKYNEMNENSRKLMDRMNSKGFIPCLFQKRLEGFILVEGRSRKKNFFFYEDMEIFDDLVFKVGIALERINLNYTLTREKEHALKSLAGSIAHEIRNPLNSINLVKNEVSHILENDTILSNPIKLKLELKELNSHISDAVDNANNIINLILADLSEKPVEAADFSYLKPKQILPEIIRKYGYRNEAEKKKVQLNLSSTFIFCAVVSRFEFIMYNLIKNALYYLDQFPSSSVSIGTEIKKIDGKDFNVIYVQDFGPGIPENVIGKLFGDFYTSGKKGGTGLGLAFCKRNMKIFDGDIICESEVGVEEEVIENGIKKIIKKAGFTKFSLLFPILSSDKLAEAKLQFEDDKKSKDNSSSQNIQKFKKILIVDDEKINLVVTKTKLERFLSNQNFKVQCDIALGGNKAIEMFKASIGVHNSNLDIYDSNTTSHYDLILMDIQMPELSGIETTKLIRDLIKANNIHLSQSSSSSLSSYQEDLPIIALTSLNYQTLTDNANKAQVRFNSYINKSSSNNLLCRSVAKWLFDYQDSFNYLADYSSFEQLQEILKNKEVLLADDQEMNRKITKKALERYGLKITEVVNGEELIKLYEQSLSDTSNQNIAQTKFSKFDVIITDINMPIISGDEAAIAIRRIEDANLTKYQNRIPIIALSGDGESKDIVKYLNSQMTDYFIKGRDPNLLIKIIVNYTKDDEVKKEVICEDEKNYVNSSAKKIEENNVVSNDNFTNSINASSSTSSFKTSDILLSKAENISTDQTNSTSLIIFNSNKLDFLERGEKLEIINLYISDSNKILGKIKEEYQVKNYLNTSVSIHSLKGITSNIGGEKLVAFIRKVEIALKKNQDPENSQEYQNWIEELEALYNELINELKRMYKI